MFTYLVQNLNRDRLETVDSPVPLIIGERYTVKSYNEMLDRDEDINILVKGRVQKGGALVSKKVRLSLCASGQWRNSDKVEVVSDDELEGIKSAVEFLQQYFELSVQIDYSPKGKSSQGEDTHNRKFR